MSLSTLDSQVNYDGDASTQEFAVPFYFIDPEDLVVYVDDVLQVETTDYTVAQEGDNSGGSITFTTAPAVGVDNVLIVRDPVLTQTVNFPTNDKFPSSVATRALDKLTMIAQRTRQLVARSFRFADTDVSGASVIVPTPVANKGLKWASDGLSLENSTEDIDTAAQEAIAAATAANAAAGLASDATDEANAAIAALNGVRINWRLAFDVETDDYVIGDAVSNSGSSYICIADAPAGQTPPNATYWGLLAAQGAPGAGTGDLLAANNLSDVNNAGTARTNLGLQIGANVQAYDADTAKTDVAQTYSKAQRGAIVALTDAANVALDLSTSNNFSLLTTSGVGATRQLQNPSNLVAGQSGIIEVTQDASGSRALTYDTQYEFENGTPFTLSTAADAIDQIAYYVPASGRVTLSLKQRVYRA